MEILPRESPNNRKTTLPCLLLVLAAATACLAWAPLLTAQNASPVARLTYTKVLKGSVPEYLAITVDASGEAAYEGRKLDEPPSPRALKLSPETARRLFQLAETLGNFQAIDLESHRKVANLGLKTFTFERDGEKHQAEFNYTQRREAQELVDLFEKIATVEQHIIFLEYAVKYDPLGLPRELMLIQIDLDKRALVDPELMVPVLEKIARNPRFLHLAQTRAQNILERLPNNK
jgi:hypothetical protein